MHPAACACPAVGSKELGGVISGYWGLAAGCLNSRRKEAAGRPSLPRPSRVCDGRGFSQQWRGEAWPLCLTGPTGSDGPGLATALRPEGSSKNRPRPTGRERLIQQGPASARLWKAGSVRPGCKVSVAALQDPVGPDGPPSRH
jgi:hypothetical protein